MDILNAGLIDNIYRKFKSYVYFDKTALHLRHKLADFESNINFDNNLNQIGYLIANMQSLNDESEEYIVSLINDISFDVIPKRFKKDNEPIDPTCIENTFEKKKYSIDKLNYIIDAPIELHLLVFYWVLKYGHELQEVYSNYNYGNILDTKHLEANNSSVTSFKPYFSQYAKWRDSGIKKAQDSYYKKEGAAILMLDIYSYYYSVSFDFEQLYGYFEDRLNIEELSEYKTLTSIIEAVFINFNRKIRPFVKNIDLSPTALPIGLSVSPLFANYYLSEFDKNFVKKVKPLYYGRYVDDIMIVFSEHSYLNINSNVTTENFVYDNLISTYGILKKSNNNYILDSTCETSK